MNLSFYVQAGRDNNFNLIRLLASIAVMHTHAYAISGQGGLDFLQRTVFQKGASFVAVDAFFVISGFLVCASVIKHGAFDYTLGRGLRIFPGLIVAMLFCVLLGGYFTSLDFISYISNDDTKDFFFHNAFLVSSLKFELPGGVFAENPLQYAVNGSIWTLPWELKCYFLILLVSLVAGYFSKFRYLFFLILCASVVFLMSSYLINLIFKYSDSGFYIEGSRLIGFFGLGALYYLARKYIPMNVFLFILFSIALWVSAKYASYNLFLLLYFLFLPYLIFYLAYIPRGVIRYYNRLGDYSYGVYIYAFPIQQTVAFYQSGNAMENFYISLFFTLILAILSWHFVEGPSLKGRAYLGNWLYKRKQRKVTN